MDVLRNKRRRIEGPEGPAPVIPRAVEEVVVVDVDEEPVATSPSQVPPTGTEMPSPLRTAAN